MSLQAISPIDGRYASKTNSLSPFFSEFALMYYRLLVEIRWLESLAEHPGIQELEGFDTASKVYLEEVLEQFDETEALLVKAYEKKTNHDVKAVEYYLRDKMEAFPPLRKRVSFVHFGLTSEDVNNIAYALILKEALAQVIQPTLAEMIASITLLGKHHADYPMLARTHGQPATPTTLGKELINVAARLKRPQQQLSEVQVPAKCNGAVGNYNAQVVAYPDVDWRKHTQHFITSLGLVFNAYTTQIEPHDGIAEISHIFMRLNTILLDYVRDIWTYISLNYFTQKIEAEEVGSSTMPHKVNPIDFENAEGNLGLANALFAHFTLKLPISRLQRDLSDSTVMRNLGVAFAHTLLAYQSIVKGNLKLEAEKEVMLQDLEENWGVLAEAIQVVLRRYQVKDAYEQLKTLTRGQKVTKAKLHRFIRALPREVPAATKEMLLKLTPAHYTGLATQLVKAFS